MPPKRRSARKSITPNATTETSVSALGTEIPTDPKPSEIATPETQAKEPACIVSVSEPTPKKKKVVRKVVKKKVATDETPAPMEAVAEEPKANAEVKAETKSETLAASIAEEPKANVEVKTEVESEAVAPVESMVEEPKANVVESEIQSEASSRTKKVLKVRKVVKKKIIKKVAPKDIALAVKEEEEAQETEKLSANELAKKDDHESDKETDDLEKPNLGELAVKDAQEPENPKAKNLMEEAQEVENPSSNEPAEKDGQEPENPSSKDLMEKAQEVENQVSKDLTEKEAQELEKPSLSELVEKDAQEPENPSSKDLMDEEKELENPSSDALKDDDAEQVTEKVVDPVATGLGDGVSEKSKRKNTEIFVGGLDRGTKEEDVRKVFEKAGEIVEVRLIMDGQTGKNKGYCFVRYADASMAKKAVTEFQKVEVCGKLCGASAVKGNDTIFLGNIDKTWKKEDIIKLLQDVGIEKIDNVTVMVNPNNPDTNRGFAFVELESTKDAQIAYKKLEKKDAFGGRNIKVAWAETTNVPSEEDMKKVKSVYVEGVPSSWDEEKVRETFKKFGEIERIVLARNNIQSAKKKDYAFVNFTKREDAMCCLESFEKRSADNDSKVSLKVSLAKSTQKDKQNRGGSRNNIQFSNKSIITGKPMAVQRDTKANISSIKGKPFVGGHNIGGGDYYSRTNDLMHLTRHQGSLNPWQSGHAGGSIQDYTHGVGVKRPLYSMGDEAYSDMRGYQRPRFDPGFPPAGSSYGSIPYGAPGGPNPHYPQHGGGYPPAAHYGAPEYRGEHQMRQGAPPPYGGNYNPRY